MKRDKACSAVTRPLLLEAYILAFLPVAVSCMESGPQAPAGGILSDDPVVFGVTYDGVPQPATKSAAEESGDGRDVNDKDDGACGTPFVVTRVPMAPDTVVTRVTEVTADNLTSFYVTTLSDGKLVAESIAYSGTPGGDYTAEGQYWPVSETPWQFYAANAPMAGTACSVTADGTADLVYAVNSAPAFRTVNSLSFAHAFGRVGDITFRLPEGYSATIVSATMTLSRGGVFSVKEGSWTTPAAQEAVALGADNDVFAVPGAYSLDIVYTYTDGTAPATTVSCSDDVYIAAGMINNIAVQTGKAFSYILSVDPVAATLDLGATRDIGARYLVELQNMGCVFASDVTADATWTASPEGVVSVNGGVVTGLAAGTATVTASYGGLTADAVITVQDAVVSYEDPVVMLSYDVMGRSGGSVSPALQYSQTVHYRSGATAVISGGADAAYSITSGDAAFSMAADGTVTAPAYDVPGGSRSCNVAVTVTLNGRSGSAAATVTQNGDAVISVDPWEITTFEYGTSAIPAGGGSAGTPTVVVTETTHYASGATTVRVVDEATPSFSGSGDLDVDASTGAVSAGSNVAETTVAYGPVDATLSYDVSDFDSDGNGKADHYRTQDINTMKALEPTLSYSQDKVTAREATSSRSVTVTVSVTRPDGTVAKAATTMMQKGAEASSVTEKVTSGAQVKYSWSGKEYDDTGTGYDGTLNTSTGELVIEANSKNGECSYGTPATTFSYASSPLAYSTTGWQYPTLSYSIPYTMVQPSTIARSFVVRASLTLNGMRGNAATTVEQDGYEGYSYTGTYTSGASVTYSGSADGFTLSTGDGGVKATRNRGSSQTTTYSNLVVNSFTYSPNPIDVDGGTAQPAVAYTYDKFTGYPATAQRSITVTATLTRDGMSWTAQAVVVQMGYDGSGTTTHMTSGGTVTYSMAAADGFTMDGASTGNVTATTNLGDEARQTTVTATVSAQGLKATSQATVMQNTSESGIIIIM